MWHQTGLISRTDLDSNIFPLLLERNIIIQIIMGRYNLRGNMWVGTLNNRRWELGIRFTQVLAGSVGERSCSSNHYSLYYLQYGDQERRSGTFPSYFYWATLNWSISAAQSISEHSMQMDMVPRSKRSQFLLWLFAAVKVLWWFSGVDRKSESISATLLEFRNQQPT